MKVIMYHYIQVFDPEYPNFRFLKFENFKKQLDYFNNNYGFVSRQEWLNFINNGTLPADKGKILLTFDDGLKCHYEFVFPELESRNLWGLFFIPTFPYLKNKILDVHRIHLLCGAFTGKELLNELLQLIKEEMIPESKVKEFKNKTYICQSNDEGVTQFKQLLNYFIDYNFRTSIINALCKKFNYELDAGDFYMNKFNLKELYDHGHLIGSHTVSHPVMSTLNKNEQYLQIKNSFKTLKAYSLIKDKIYCHPYGGFHSFNKDTENLLIEERVRYSFNVEAREIVADDFEKSMQFLPRFDCNLFKYGKAS